MRLLFDENLSPRLVPLLRASFPESQHVEPAGLQGQTDAAIWEYAHHHRLCIVSKDNDFRQLSFLKGPPPKVIWLSVGNAGTNAIADLLRQSQSQIEERDQSRRPRHRHPRRLAVALFPRRIASHPLTHPVRSH